MTGGGFRITQDLPPFILTAGEPLQYKELNVIGLRRRGFSNEETQLLKRVYMLINDKSLNICQARARISSELGEESYVKDVLSFIARSKRGLIGK